MKIEIVKIENLIPYEFNNKIHDETQVNRIANSIKEFGFLQPVVIDKNNVIIAGHGRFEASQKLWLKNIPCVRAENLTETQIKKFRILDNKLNESAWNEDNLKIELQELENFDIGELQISVEDLFPDLQIISPDGFGDWFSLPDWEKTSNCQMTFTLSEEQKQIIEEWIDLVKQTDQYKCQMNYWNENANGNALFCIVEQWVNANK